MTKDEALTQALEALKNSQDYKQGRASAVEAVEDIEEALAQPEQEKNNWLPTGNYVLPVLPPKEKNT